MINIDTKNKKQSSQEEAIKETPEYKKGYRDALRRAKKHYEKQAKEKERDQEDNSGGGVLDTEPSDSEKDTESDYFVNRDGKEMKQYKKDPDNEGQYIDRRTGKSIHEDDIRSKPKIMGVLGSLGITLIKWATGQETMSSMMRNSFLRTVGQASAGIAKKSGMSNKEMNRMVDEISTGTNITRKRIERSAFGQALKGESKDKGQEKKQGQQQKGSNTSSISSNIDAQIREYKKYEGKDDKISKKNRQVIYSKIYKNLESLFKAGGNYSENKLSSAGIEIDIQSMRNKIKTSNESIEIENNLKNINKVINDLEKLVEITNRR
jgi:hypothetical protein